MNVLVQYLKKQHHLTNKEMQIFVCENDAEAIHRLRVALKKIRAAYRFLTTQEVPELIRKKYKQKMLPFFKETGELRCLHLYRQLLQKHQWQQMILFSESLQNEVIQTYLLKKRFKTAHKVIHQLTNILQAKAATVKEEEALRYAIKLHQTILYAAAAKNIEDWHELRKQIKQLLYSYQWLPHNLQLRLLTVNQFKQLDVLQEAIGQWHDLQDLKDWLGAEGFFMSSSPAVKKEFAKAWLYVNRQLTSAEKKLQSFLMPVGKQKAAAFK